MINLFNIPNYTIDTSNFSNVINDPLVEKFESKFADFVGAKYACGFNSATNAIFLSFLNKHQVVNVPSMIPPVVLNALMTGGNKINFIDNIDWIGHSYILHQFSDYKIIDSAQKVEKNQFLNEANDEDLMIFSFYPTKPVGSLDGGIIVSNDKEKIKYFKIAAMNGMSSEKNNWDRECYFPGWKSYLSTIQAYVADKNLDLLESKQKRISQIRDYYNQQLKLSNTSCHLYRLNVNNQKSFIKTMYSNNIVTGIHYRSAHDMIAYSKQQYSSSLEKTNTLTISLFDSFISAK